jgi:hypothetical protein
MTAVQWLSLYQVYSDNGEFQEEVEKNVKPAFSGKERMELNLNLCPEGLTQAEVAQAFTQVFKDRVIEKMNYHYIRHALASLRYQAALREQKTVEELRSAKEELDRTKEALAPQTAEAERRFNQQFSLPPEVSELITLKMKEKEKKVVMVAPAVQGGRFFYYAVGAVLAVLLLFYVRNKDE